MTGLTFANHLASFVRSHKDIPIKDPVNVEANPEQSKHLATARMTILGLEIDVVNLRCEEYAENSRIPNQIVGTDSLLMLWTLNFEISSRLVRLWSTHS